MQMFVSSPTALREAVDMNHMKNSCWKCCQNQRVGKFFRWGIFLLVHLFWFLRAALFATSGENGAYCIQKGDENAVHHKGLNVQALETIGAGDSFIAGVIFSLLTDLKSRSSIQSALKFGCICGAQKCSQVGFQGIGQAALQTFIHSEQETKFST